MKRTPIREAHKPSLLPSFEWKPSTVPHQTKQWSFLGNFDTSPQSSSLFASSASFPKSPGTRTAPGYLVFTQDHLESAGPCRPSIEVRASDANDNGESAWEARTTRDATLHQQQVALEEAEARKGEEIWVYMGGILRDKEGNRDWAKTKAIREELELREFEANLRNRWKKYENGWKGLLESTSPLKFGDIPWPIDEAPPQVTLADLRRDVMAEFFLGDLKVRDSKTTKKDRIRSSLLRWHPDKMTAIVARVVEDDLARVMAGVRLVFECLQQLLQD